jgi:hypothetical protein
MIFRVMTALCMSNRLLYFQCPRRSRQNVLLGVRLPESAYRARGTPYSKRTGLHGRPALHFESARRRLKQVTELAAHDAQFSKRFSSFRWRGENIADPEIADVEPALQDCGIRRGHSGPQAPVLRSGQQV